MIASPQPDSSGFPAGQLVQSFEDWCFGQRDSEGALAFLLFWLKPSDLEMAKA